MKQGAIFVHGVVMADEFHTTRWSLVLTAAHGEGSSACNALESLCHDAWRPLYAYARRWGCLREDAEDVVQGFIASLLTRQSLSQVGPGKGRFRSFLLAGMRNHMSDVISKNHAQKRGGYALHLSMDADSAEHGYLSLAADTETPERAFDRIWAMEILDKAKSRLQQECQASGKADLYAALFPDTKDHEIESYAIIGERLGLSETALRTISMRLRRRWKELIRDELAQGVSSREALDEEMACLQAALLD